MRKCICKQSGSVLQRFCTDADTRNVLQCLKQNKNSELMDPKCKQMITKRQITQNTGQSARLERIDDICKPDSLTHLLLFLLQTTG